MPIQGSFERRWPRLLSFGLIGSAAAHSIWVERDGDGARIFFGEFDENLREASPGLLDRLSPKPRSCGQRQGAEGRQAGRLLRRCRPARQGRQRRAETAPHRASRRQADKVLTRWARAMSPISRSGPGQHARHRAGRQARRLQGLLSGQAAGQGQARADRRVRLEARVQDRRAGRGRGVAAVARRLCDRGPAYRRHAGQAGRGGLRLDALRQHALRFASPTACRARRSRR